MAVYYPYPVQCNCGAVFNANVANSVNGGRNPAVREQILAGTFHRVPCPSCGSINTVEKEFFYTDLSRNTLIKVNPRQERHVWKEASARLDRANEMVPAGLTAGGHRHLRVVFGLSELREKLIAQDAGLDDRLVEVLKVYLIQDHPFLVHRPRLRLSLDRVTLDEIEFVASYDFDAEQFRLELPWGVAQELLAKEQLLTQWLLDSSARVNPGGGRPIQPAPGVAGGDQSGDHWVNLWRWSPQPSVLDRLRGYADEVEAGRDIDTTTHEFRQMLQYLPRGAHLPAWAKQDLQVLFQYARQRGLAALQDSLFEIRFDKALEDDWAFNDDPDDIDTLWKLLKDLPDSNVDGNVYIRSIMLDEGEGGGFYQPSTRDIYIGGSELTNQERFEDIVRHEVGHAVHEQRVSEVDQWLRDRFGWQTFPRTDAGINGWVALMGGWGNLSPTEQAQVRDYLRSAVGPGSSWTAGPRPNAPANHPWRRADFGPRLAYEQTGNNWYQNYRQWYRFNGRAFFLNYWYRTFIVVDEATLDLVDQMPDNYASMSHFEFFAELYALYFDLDDPTRRNIPADVAQWLANHLGAPEINAPGAPARPERPEYYDVDRPETNH